MKIKKEKLKMKNSENFVTLLWSLYKLVTAFVIKISSLRDY